MVTKLSAPARVIIHDLFLYHSDNNSLGDIVDDKNHGRNDDDDDCVMVSVRPRTITGTTLAYETPARPSDAEDNISVEDDPADLHHIVVCQGNPIDKMVFPDNSDDDHDERTPGPVVFNS